MKKGKKWIILVIVLIIAVVGGLLLLRGRNAKARAAEVSAEEQNTATAYIGSIRVTTEGSGILAPADQTTYTSEYSLEIERVDAEPGDVVMAGDVIAAIDPDSIQRQIDQMEEELADLDSSISNMTKTGSYYMTSPVAGRVKRIYVEEGDILTDVVARYGGLMEISADGKLKLTFESQEELAVGSTVTVAFLSYEVDGTVVAAEGREYTVTIRDDTEYPVDTAAEVKDDAGNVLGEGVLESNAPYLVTASYGRCTDINVTTTSRVYVDTLLLYREDDDYNADYRDALDKRQEILADIHALRALADDPVIRAAEDGIISEIALAERQPTNEGAAMYTLISTERYWLKAEIDELDVAGVKAGQDVTIVFDAFEDEEYPGTVEKVSALGTNTGGVTRYTVTISLEGEEQVKPGMSATATITLEEKEDALLIPVDAVESRNGVKFVTVISGGESVQMPVTLGLVNSTLAEVTEGLVEGQQVVAVSGGENGDIISQMMTMRDGDRQERDQ